MTVWKSFWHCAFAYYSPCKIASICPSISALYWILFNLKIFIYCLSLEYWKIFHKNLIIPSMRKKKLFFKKPTYLSFIKNYSNLINTPICFQSKNSQNIILICKKLVMPRDEREQKWVHQWFMLLQCKLYFEHISRCC